MIRWYNCCCGSTQIGDFGEVTTITRSGLGALADRERTRFLRLGEALNFGLATASASGDIAMVSSCEETTPELRDCLVDDGDKTVFAGKPVVALAAAVSTDFMAPVEEVPPSMGAIEGPFRCSK